MAGERLRSRPRPVPSVAGRPLFPSTRWLPRAPKQAILRTRSNTRSWQSRVWKRAIGRLKCRAWSNGSSNIRAARPSPVCSVLSLRWMTNLEGFVINAGQLIPANVGWKSRVDPFGIVQGSKSFQLGLQFSYAQFHGIEPGHRRPWSRLEYLLELLAQIFPSREFRDARLIAEMRKTGCVRDSRIQSSDLIHQFDSGGLATGPNPALGEVVHLRDADLASV